MNEEHRNFGAILAFVEFLPGFKDGGIKVLHFYLAEHLRKQQMYKW